MLAALKGPRDTGRRQLARHGIISGACRPTPTMRGMRILIVMVAVSSLAAAAPEPQKIALTRVFPGPGQIGLFIAAADGSDERPLLAVRDADYDPAWAPDGASIVFTSEREGSADLFRVKPDGTALERLTDNPAYDDQAAFSPDGRQLVFVSSRHDGIAAFVDDGPADAAGETVDVGERRRLPAVVVARRQMDRLLFRSRQHPPVRPRPMGTPAPGRSLSDSSRRHRFEAHHRARELLRQPEVAARQPACHRLLHDGRADAREPPGQPRARKRHAARLVRHRRRRIGGRRRPDPA